MITEHDILLFLLQLLLLLGCARALGELFRRWGQPAIVAEVLVGMIFGPSILGNIARPLYDFMFPADHSQHKVMMETMSQVGVLFLLLVNGLDVDISMAWKQRRDSFAIAVSDIIIPLAIGFGAAMLIPKSFMVDDRRILFAAFVGTAATISALPVAMRALHDLNMLRTDMGLLIISALTINDVVGWVLFTIILGIASPTGVDLMYIARVLLATIGFAAFCLTLGRRLATIALYRLKGLGLPEPATSLTFVVLMGLAGGTITQLVGIHALFGFFLAGIMIGDSPAMSERTKEIIEQMVYSIFVPLFFVGIGMKIDFQHFNVLLVVGLSAVRIVARFIGAYVGTLKSSVAVHDRVPISVAHTPGGAMEIVVGAVAREMGLISPEIFAALVFGAVVSSALVGPWLAWAMKRRRKIRVLDFFIPKAFVLDLKAHTVPDVIRELAESLAHESGMPPADAIAQAVQDREQTMSTAAGESVAFPHARMTAITKPAVVMGISSAGIEWDAPDGRSVHYVFMILTPADDIESQVTILAAIARMISKPENKSRLLLAGDNAQAWETIKASLIAEKTD
ncbi:MAG TPA: cation:proton antiporter [Planctomycetota bacterium]|nr:cation:proton antiporter [Planctomycetota bacterium]